jgi:hypothetical protein
LLVTITFLHLGCASSGPPPVTQAPPASDRSIVSAGRQVAEKYTAGDLRDYEVVWTLYGLDPNERSMFLDGFLKGLTQADNRQRREVRMVLQGAVSGNHYQTAMDLGSKHAAGVVTNEQIQGAIRSSRHVSEAVSLGWKAGYIRGFSAQQVAEMAAKSSVNEEMIGQLDARAAAAYHALRAATGK